MLRSRISGSVAFIHLGRVAVYTTMLVSLVSAAGFCTRGGADGGSRQRVVPENPADPPEGATISRLGSDPAAVGRDTPVPSPGLAPVLAGGGAIRVISFGFTGRTAVAAEELGRIFHADVVHVGIAPPREALVSAGMDEVAPDQAPEVVKVPLGTQLLFLGFPIWWGEPPEAVLDLVSESELDGCTVVLFFTHQHSFRDDTMDELRQAVAAAGGTCLDPMAIRLPMAIHRDGIRLAVREALDGRIDPSEDRSVAKGPTRCTATCPRTGAHLCHVPEGYAFVPTPVMKGWVIESSGILLTNVPAFEIDEGEVLLAAYEMCVKEGVCQAIDPGRSECATLRAPHLPVPCASFEDARTFCAWREMRLPTLAEWTRAYRGSRSRGFPWGVDFALDGTLGNFAEPQASAVGPRWIPDSVASAVSDRFSGLSPPCSFPKAASRWGVCDLAGNLTEWVSGDRSPHPLLVGGSWTDWAEEAFAVEGAISLPVPRLRIDVVGFRCARDMLQEQL